MSLLIKANCSLVLLKNILNLAIGDPNYQIGRKYNYVRINVLDTIIALLAERRRDLQSRLSNLPIIVSINTTILRDNRILDEYAEYTEYTK